MSKSDPPHKLIETIYRAALEPQGYDAFMIEWNDWLQERLAALDSLRESDPAFAAPEFATHFELASRLLERVAEPPASQNAPKGPQMLIDLNGAILWQNGEAGRLFGQSRGRTVQDLIQSDHQRAELAELLDHMPSTSAPPPLILHLAPRGADTRALPFRAEPMRDGPETNLILLASITPTWPAAADNILSHSHDLSPGECEICAYLAQGKSAATIADLRGRSLATVRTQIKKIQAKTGLSSQPELVAYLHSVMRLAEDMPVPQRAVAEIGHTDSKLVEVALRTRTMTVELHGPEDGAPVLFLHGMLDGTGVTRRAVTALHDLGLRLICPHRPSFGAAEPDTGDPALAPLRLAEHLAELVGKLGLGPPVMVGHMAGSVYAFAAAPACNATGIVNVSGGVPIRSPAQFASMTRRQRLVAYTARYTPSVLPFVLRAGIRQIKGGAAPRFLHSLYEHAPVDNALVQDDEIRDLILEGYRYTVTQGHAAFQTDSYQVVRDWSGLVDASAPCPVRLIHGAHDPVVSPDSVRDFAARYPDRIRLDLRPDAGQLVFYQEPETVLRSVREMVDQPQA